MQICWRPHILEKLPNWFQQALCCTLQVHLQQDFFLSVHTPLHICNRWSSALLQHSCGALSRMSCSPFEPSKHQEEGLFVQGGCSLTRVTQAFQEVQEQPLVLKPLASCALAALVLLLLKAHTLIMYIIWMYQNAQTDWKIVWASEWAGQKAGDETEQRNNYKQLLAILSRILAAFVKIFSTFLQHLQRIGQNKPLISPIWIEKPNVTALSHDVTQYFKYCMHNLQYMTLFVWANIEAQYSCLCNGYRSYE